jgi:general secretion pathway protein L
LTLALFLGKPLSWLRFDGSEAVDRGEGIIVAEPGERVVAIVPGRDVAVHRAALPNLTEAQARAAARLVIADVSVSNIDNLHVAVGAADDDGNRTIVAIDCARMGDYLSDAAINGFDPDVIVAAPLLLPPSLDDYVRADLGAETIVRGPDSAFADDPAVTPLVTAGQERVLEGQALEYAIAGALAQPEVDLRQGAFARRRSFAIDHGWLRRFATMALVLLGLTLLIKIVEIVRLNRAAGAIEANNKQVAAAALPAGTTITDPALQLRNALAARAGPGGGLVPLAAAVIGAIEATPGVDLSNMVFDGGGTLRVTLRAQRAGDLATIEAKLSAMGLAIAPGALITDQGRSVRDITVSRK